MGSASHNPLSLPNLMYRDSIACYLLPFHYGHMRQISQTERARAGEISCDFVTSYGTLAFLRRNCQRLALIMCKFIHAKNNKDTAPTRKSMPVAGKKIL